MSRSRNYERSRKGPDTIRAIQHRQSLLTEGADQDLDLVSLPLDLSQKTTSSIHIIDTGKRVHILLTEETAHARLVS